jgi:hypothetical protein
VIELLQGRVVVAAIALIGGGEVLARMHVMHRERARVALGDRGLQVFAAEQHQ